MNSKKENSNFGDKKLDLINQLLMLAGYYDRLVNGEIEPEPKDLDEECQNDTIFGL